MRAALEEREPVAVGMDSVEGAIRLVEYFRQEAIKIHKLVYGKDIRISMTEQQRKAYDALPPSFRIAAAREDSNRPPKKSVTRPADIRISTYGTAGSYG